MVPTIQSLIAECDRNDFVEIVNGISDEEFMEKSTFSTELSVDDRYRSKTPIMTSFISQSGTTTATVRSLSDSKESFAVGQGGGSAKMKINTFRRIWSENGRRGFRIIKKSENTEIKLIIGSTTATVNGNNVILEAAPEIKNGNTMLPLRFITEQLDCKVDWEQSTQTVTITKNTDVIKLQLGNTTATVNGIEVTLDAPPVIQNGSTMLPLRFIAEQLKCKVDWEQSTQTVTITKSDVTNE